MQDINGREVRMFDVAVNEDGIKGVVTGHMMYGDARFYIGFRVGSIGAILLDRKPWEGRRIEVIGRLGLRLEPAPYPVSLPGTSVIPGHGCTAYVTDAGDGTGVIEIESRCKIAKGVRRSFRTREEREKLIKPLLNLRGRRDA